MHVLEFKVFQTRILKYTFKKNCSLLFWGKRILVGTNASIKNLSEIADGILNYFGELRVR